jgi:rRNA-processing protein FCF1
VTEPEVVHAPGEGDDTIVDIAGVAAAGQAKVTVVTADRGLAERVRARGAEVVGPTWLLDRLPEETGCSGVESAGP